MGPRSSGVEFHNLHFYNFGAGTTILSTCNKCDNTDLFVNTVNEYKVSGVTFTNVTGSYVHMAGLKRDIVHDLDGTFSRHFDSASRSSAALAWHFPHLLAHSACLPSA